jgi:uncharacterized protein YaiE (UPF0345 family)
MLVDGGLDYSDKVTLVVTRVSFMGDPTHWEFDVLVDGGVEAGGTAPSFAGVVDGACRYLWDERPEWTRFNANGDD